MKYPDNIRDLALLPIDFMGIIFYNKSPRFIGESDVMEIIPANIRRVGVFVNAEIHYIVQMTGRYNLDIIQLHGNESPDFCKELNKSTPVIKAFSIANSSDFEQTKQYEDIVNYFLFDTKTPQYGGSGQKFDWNILNEYKGNTPFFLSGGISIDDIHRIKEIKHPQLYGLDLNSRFETEPGLKDIQLLKQFIKELKDE